MFLHVQLSYIFHHRYKDIHCSVNFTINVLLLLLNQHFLLPETSCPNVVNIPYGMVSDVTTGRNEGARRRFECVHGYKMTGASYAICHNQNWIPGVPQCVRKSAS